MCCKTYLLTREFRRVNASCRQPEHLVDRTVLCEEVPSDYSLELAFAEHVHGFIALDGPLQSGDL
jgi:hypothetical protein